MSKGPDGRGPSLKQIRIVGHRKKGHPFDVMDPVHIDRFAAKGKTATLRKRREPTAQATASQQRRLALA